MDSKRFKEIQRDSKRFKKIQTDSKRFKKIHTRAFRLEGFLVLFLKHTQDTNKKQTLKQKGILTTFLL